MTRTSRQRRKWRDLIQPQASVESIINNSSVLPFMACSAGTGHRYFSLQVVIDNNLQPVDSLMVKCRVVAG